MLVQKTIARWFTALAVILLLIVAAFFYVEIRLINKGIPYTPNNSVYVALLPTVAVLFFISGCIRHRYKHGLWTINMLRKMDWQRFEKLCRDYFALAGFDSRLTASNGGDGGVDVVLQKGRDTGYVQCKAWSSEVGVDVAQELYGVMQADRVHRGVLATLGGATMEARQFAFGKSIMILDGYDLIGLFRKLRDEDQVALQKGLPI